MRAMCDGRGYVGEREKMFLFWRIDVCVCVVLSPPPPAAFWVVKLSDPMMSLLLLPSLGGEADFISLTAQTASLDCLRRTFSFSFSWHRPIEAAIKFRGRHTVGKKVEKKKEFRSD